MGGMEIVWILLKIIKFLMILGIIHQLSKSVQSIENFPGLSVFGADP